MLNFIRLNMTAEGRIARKVYWQVTALIFGTFLILGVVSVMPFLKDIFANINNDIFGPFEIIVTAFIVFIFFSLLVLNVYITIRRFHDINMSGWWILLGIIPYLGSLIILIMCGFFKGTSGSNKYGEESVV